MFPTTCPLSQNGLDRKREHPFPEPRTRSPRPPVPGTLPAAAIVAAAHPGQAKDLGRRIRNFEEETWRAHRTAIVTRGNEAKFALHDEMRRPVSYLRGNRSTSARPGSVGGMERALEIAAGGRVAWGALALAAPGLNVKLAGMGHRDAPELRYMIRIFGSRAVALGAGYLLSDPAARRRWRRLCLLVDACDTAAGLVHLIRGDVPRGAAAGLVAVTGTYAMLDALSIRTIPAPGPAPGSGHRPQRVNR